MWRVGRLGAAVMLILGLVLSPGPVAMADDGASIEVVVPISEVGGPASEGWEGGGPTESVSSITTDPPAGGTFDDSAGGRVVVEVQGTGSPASEREDSGPEDAAGTVRESAPAATTSEAIAGVALDDQEVAGAEGPVSHEEPDGADTEPGAQEEPGGHDPGEHEDPGDHDDSDGHDSDHGGHPAKLSCSEIDVSWVELELKGHPISGTYTIGDDFRTVQIAVFDASAGGKYVNWSSSGPIDAVILRSGQDAATYEYEPAALGGLGLVPPLKDRDGRNLSSVLACYDPAEAVVGIDVFLADSDDPVEVGDVFAYVVSVGTSAPLVGAEITITLAPEVRIVDGGGCDVDGDVVRCQPPLDTSHAWQASITVEAVAAGNAITSAAMTAVAGDETVLVSAVEVTRVIGSPGSGGGCGGHEDGDDDGHEPGHEPGDDEDGCPGAMESLLEACAAFDPGATALLLPGPFASRQYLLEGANGVRIWVTVGEGSGFQAAAWEANVPIDVVFTRTGQDVSAFPYSPAALGGTGIVGPAGGSGRPRPMADMAFCWIDRAPVDVAITASGPGTLSAGEDGVLELTIQNRGYASAAPMSIRIRASNHVDAPSCADPLGCPVALGPAETVVLSIPVTGKEPGLAQVVAEILVPAEPPELGDDNVAYIEFVVEGSSTSDELPETGPVDSLWLLVAGTVLIAIGSRLTRFGTTRRPG